jgi:hypothetical protein
MESQDEYRSKLEIERFDPKELELDHLKALVRNPAFRVMFFECAENLQGAINSVCAEHVTDNIYRYQGAVEAYQRVMSFVPVLEQELFERDHNAGN